MRLCLVACLVLAACDDKTPSTLLAGPRVLAIVADPPVLTPASSTTLAATTSLDGFPVPPDRIAWRACSPYAVIVDPVRDCEGDRAFALPVDELGRGLADARTIADHFGLPVPADVPTDACAVLPSLTLVTEIELGGARLVAKKDVALAAILARTNPAFVHVRVNGAPLDGSASFAAGTTVALSADLAIDAIDTVCDVGELRREEVRVVVYPGGGATASDDAFDVVDRDGVITAGSVDLNLPPTAGTVPLWLVAVDESGGAAVTFIELAVR